MFTKEQAFRRIDERGPRFAVYGGLGRPNEGRTEYADTAEAAERLYQQFNDQHYRQVKVYPPQGGIDLAELGRKRAQAKAAFDEATAVLRAGVLRAIEEKRSEVEIARTSGVDRQTVRSWAGK